MPLVGVLHNGKLGVAVGALASKVDDSIIYWRLYTPVGVYRTTISNGLSLGDVFVDGDQQTN